MNTFKYLYYYFFYKLCKLYENSFYTTLADFRALISVITLKICFLFSIINYAEVFTKKNIINSNPYHITNIIIFALFILMDIYMLVVKSEWKLYFKEFDKLPNIKNRNGCIAVAVIILFIFMNLIYSFYLMSQIDWQRYN